MMIGKIKIGTGFRGALNYNFRESKGNVIASTMAGKTARELAAEFGAIRALRPSMTRAVFHTSISIAPGEKLSDDQWRFVSDKVLNGLDFDGSQSVVFRHDDTEHPHIHILANRIRIDGSVVSDSKNYARLEKIMRDLEKELGLKIVMDSVDAPRRAPTPGELARFARTGEPSTKMRLQQLCDAAADGCTSVSAYETRLALAGVDIIPVMQLAGAKFSGATYRLDGVLMKASDLGKSYTPAGLAKRGVTYEQDRDYEAIQRCIDRENARNVSADDSAAADAGAGSSDRAADGRDVADVSQFEIDRQPVDGDRVDAAAPGQATDAIAQPEQRERNSNATRIDIAEVSQTVRKIARPALERDLDAKRQAWRTQHAAIGAPLYQVSMQSADGKTRLLDACDAESIEKTLPNLQQHEKHGHDVEIRAIDPERHFIGFHDLTPGQLDALDGAGYMPTLVLQRGHDVHSAIIATDRTAHADDAALVQGVAKTISAQVGNARFDIDAAMPMAGFKQRGPGIRAIARIITAARVLCRRTKKLLADALDAVLDIAARARAAETQAKRRAIIMSPDLHPPAGQIRQYMQLARQLLTQSPRSSIDEIDVRVAREMLNSGLARDEIERPIAVASPGAVAYGVIAKDYARETLNSALASGGSSGTALAPQKRVRLGEPKK